MLSLIYLVLIVLLATQKSSSFNSSTSSSIPKPPSPNSLTFGLIIRSYKGDESKCSDILIPTLHAFVDRTKVHILFLLDAESEEDHEYGERLVRQGFHVDFEFLPDFVSHGPIPYAVLNGTRYATVGYSRQLFSTFYFDLYLRTDIIGILDCDNMLYSYPVIQDIVDEKGRIYAAGMRNNHYRDHEAMKEPVYHDYMYTDVMPKFIHRETFAQLRQHFFRLYKAQNFSSVWKEIGKSAISPVNILLEYGWKYTPDKYRLVMSNDTRGMITLGSNRPSRGMAMIGCCHIFPDFTCPFADYKNHTEHILFFNNVYLDESYEGHDNVAFRYNYALVEEHYRHVHKSMAGLPQAHTLSMKHHCEKIITGHR